MGSSQANDEPSRVLAQSRLHDPNSPFLIGNYREDDKIHDVPQESWIDGQMTIMPNSTGKASLK